MTQSSCARHGSISIILLVSLPLLLVLVIVVFNASMLAEGSILVQNRADAASLTATGVLADDLVLLRQQPVMPRLLQSAREQARAYLRANPTIGKSAELDFNLNNHNDGDIVFGFATPQSKFRPAIFDPNAKTDDPSLKDLTAINAVKITVHRTRQRRQPFPLIGGHWTGRPWTDMIRSSIAILDRDVIGFRAVFDHKRIPLAPIALLSHRGVGDSESITWQGAIEQGGGGDLWQRDRQNRRYRPHAQDGLPEMWVHLVPREKENEPPEKPNAALLQIGIRTIGEAEVQIQDGISKKELEQFPGDFVLGGINQSLMVPGQLLPSTFPTLSTEALKGALLALRQSHEARIWPLFSFVDARQQLVQITGFVAARVVAVGDPTRDYSLSFILQPTQITTPTVVTGASQQRGIVRAVNRYISKLRLINKH